MERMLKISKNKLTIGTVQFGLNYGISNQDGKVNFSEVKKIIEFAKKSGISFIDTAQSYGRCESILGNIGIQHYNIITKIKPLNQNISLHNSFTNSLKKLKLKSIYAILYHSSLDTIKYPKSYQSLLNLKTKNSV